MTGPTDTVADTKLEVELYSQRATPAQRGRRRLRVSSSERCVTLHPCESSPSLDGR